LQLTGQTNRNNFDAHLERRQSTAALDARRQDRDQELAR
jgi:hypothetical protein